MKTLFLVLISGWITAMFCTIGFAADAAAPSEIKLTDQLKITTQQQHEEDTQKLYKIDVEFPQIEGETLSETALQFNTIVSDMIKKDIDQFKELVKKDTVHSQTLPEELRHNTLNIHYDLSVVKPNNQNLLSVKINIEGFQAGRAHPYHNTQVINFDLTTGKLLTLKQLFKPHSHYLPVIAEYSKLKLKETLEDKWMIDTGTKPIEKNYQNWNLDSANLLISFDEYQVAPYSYGKQVVAIPYEVLKKIVPTSSPIHPCVVNPSSCK